MLNDLVCYPEDDYSHRVMANAIRVLSMDAVQRANSGHPGLPMGMADVATVLFSKFLKFDPDSPSWPDRDRFVLSAGHGSMLLYSLLYLTGYSDITIDELKKFRQLGAKTAGHPEYGFAAGIEMTTGPLGQGIATAVGMALGEKLLAGRYGSKLVDHHTYVLAGDGCLMEGISHEAIDLAGHLQLSKLIVLFDNNGISIDGSTELATSMDQVSRFDAAGWNVAHVDGHDPQAISEAIESAQNSQRPTLIACKTIIGYGSPTKSGTASTHGSPLGVDEVASTRTALDWKYEPFDIPKPVLDCWRKAGKRSSTLRKDWEKRHLKLNPDDRSQFDNSLAATLPSDLATQIQSLKKTFLAQPDPLATRQSSQKVLEVLVKSVPHLLGGSADLTGSNGTQTSHSSSVTAENSKGNYIHYGVREHGMAAAMNGLALHGGFIPYGGTFLAFADYSRPAIRLAALMHQRVVHVMTHDSIGLGEDGPTHQPVEQIASLRAMPNVLVFRPADSIEMAETWQCALEEVETPSVLCLTRQALPLFRSDAEEENKVARGAYVIRKPIRKRDATLLATGSEVEIALKAAALLEQFGISIAVVSMPCWELFERQPAKYRLLTLGTAPRIAIEAGCGMGWDRWIGENGAFIGMSGFGASAPASELYELFGITPEVVRDKVRELLQP